MVKPRLQNLWPARLTTALVWALAAAGAVFWALRLGEPAQPGPAAVAAPAPLAPNAQGLAHLLGQRSAPAAIAVVAAEQKSAYQLLGVLAGTRSQRGAALIAVDGKAAKPYRVGATIEGPDGLVLQSLQGREARLGATLDGATAQVLQMPQFKADADGSAAKDVPVSRQAARSPSASSRR